MPIEVFFHPHLMELSVFTQSELKLLILTYGLGRTRLLVLHLIEVAEQPRMKEGGGGKSARGIHHVRQNILYRLHAPLCAKRAPPLCRNILRTRHVDRTLSTAKLSRLV